jgi:hypothetical protein
MVFSVPNSLLTYNHAKPAKRMTAANMLLGWTSLHVSSLRENGDIDGRRTATGAGGTLQR